MERYSEVLMKLCGTYSGQREANIKKGLLITSPSIDESSSAMYVDARRARLTS